MSKPVLILISGWAHTPAALHGLAETLSGSFAVTRTSTADLWSRDGNASPYVEGLRELLECRGPATVAGWSMGGMAALETALIYPALIARLVLVGTCAKFRADGDDAGVPASHLRAMARDLKRRRRHVLERFFEQSAAPFREAGLEEKVSAACSISIEELLSGLEYLTRFDVSAKLQGVKIPALVIHGREDRIVPWHAARLLASCLANSRLILDDECGHSLPEQRPDRLAREIIGFCGATGTNPATVEAKRLASRFSAASTTYDRTATAQFKVVRTVCEMLDGAGRPDRILEIGCGTGVLTEKLVERFPGAAIEAVDISEKMIARARMRLSGKGGISWIVSDIGHLSESTVYPLIVSCSALHWINPIETGLRKLARLLDESGLMVFGLMVEGTLGELRAARLRAAPRKPPLGKLPAAVDVRSALDHAGFTIQEHREEEIVITYPSASALLQAIHDQGVTGGEVSSARAPLNRSELRSLSADYDATYRSDKGVYATYRVACYKVSACKKKVYS